MSRISSAEAQARIAAHDLRVVAEIERLSAEVTRHHEDMRGLRGRLHDAWAELGAALVPSLDPGPQGALAARLELPSIAGPAVAARIDGERQDLVGRIAAIEVREEYQHRDGLLGECVLQIQALRERMAPLQRSLASMRGEPFFDELIDVEYDTPHYGIQWWSFKYYRHWRRGDAILERLGPLTRAATFGELRRRYLEERGALAGLAGEWEAWTTRKATIESLISAHAAATESLATLGPRSLAETRARVVDHLQGQGEAAAAALADGEPTLRPLVRRIAGVVGQRECLLKIHQAWVERPRQEIVKIHGENERDLIKVAQAPNLGRTFDAAAIDRRTRALDESWAERRASYEAGRRAILDYDAYDTADLERGSWWSVIVPDTVRAAFDADADADAGDRQSGDAAVTADDPDDPDDLDDRS